MQIIINENEKLILRFDKGEDVIKELIYFADQQAIHAAHFTGLGACGSATLAYYDLKNKEYLDKKIDEDLEIVSLIGNIAELKNETVIHAHGVLANRKYLTFGGHIKKLIVSATCEIHLTVLKSRMERGYDETTGLNLLR